VAVAVRQPSGTWIQPIWRKLDHGAAHGTAIFEKFADSLKTPQVAWAIIHAGHMITRDSARAAR
jgi:hypothetical protein